jgi:hypothetical protein
MTNFLHWRKMTWAFVLWSGYIAIWAMITGAGTTVVAVWLAGAIVASMLWFATQPVFQKGRGLSGFFVWPGWTDWRVVNLHRRHGAMQSRRDEG